MKQILLIILFHVVQLSFANMASPVQEGSSMARPFISQHVDIIKETILIIPDANFQTAQFQIEYHINANKSEIKIPFLFYASEFKEKFKIWVDDKEIKLNKVPEPYQSLEGTPFNDFDYLFETQTNSQTKQVLIEESPSSGFYVSIDDLKFFEADLSKGNHIIRVEYIADKWVDRSEWVKEYSFRYVLSPAKLWKSFGDLEITIDGSKFEGNLTTNLGVPKKGNLQSKSIWTFKTIPTEVLHIYYIPPIPPLAKTLLLISPLGLTFFIALVLILLHYIFIRKYRKANSVKRYSWVMTLGSVFVPLFILFSYLYMYDIIDWAIGKDASKYHGYVFLIIFIYPVFLLVYWLIMWQVDKKMKESFNN